MTRTDRFDFERARIIIWAFDAACKAVEPHPPADSVRNELARIITGLAGEITDERQLCDEALARLKAAAACSSAADSDARSTEPVPR